MAKEVTLKCDLEVAWAAGFFDGEGNCCISTATKRGRTYKAFHFRITQSGVKCPDTLIRFREALGNIGVIAGPFRPRGLSKQPHWHFRINNREEGFRAIEMLLPFVSSAKREQMLDSMEQIEQHEEEISKRVRRSGAELAVVDG